MAGHMSSKAKNIVRCQECRAECSTLKPSSLVSACCRHVEAKKAAVCQGVKNAVSADIYLSLVVACTCLRGNARGRTATGATCVRSYCCKYSFGRALTHAELVLVLVCVVDGLLITHQPAFFFFNRYSGCLISAFQ